MSNQPWLTVSPASGAGTGNLKINVGLCQRPDRAADRRHHDHVDRSGQHRESHRGDAQRVNANGNTAPEGTFDTPIDGTTDISGSIAVTGWAVDDVEVTRVRIMRHPVAG